MELVKRSQDQTEPEACSLSLPHGPLNDCCFLFIFFSLVYMVYFSVFLCFLAKSYDASMVPEFLRISCILCMGVFFYIYIYIYRLLVLDPVCLWLILNCVVRLHNIWIIFTRPSTGFAHWLLVPQCVTTI